MQHQTVTHRPNGAPPSRAQIEPAVLALLSRHSAGLSNRTNCSPLFAASEKSSVLVAGWPAAQSCR